MRFRSSLCSTLPTGSMPATRHDHPLSRVSVALSGTLQLDCRYPQNEPVCADLEHLQKGTLSRGNNRNSIRMKGLLTLK